MANMKFTVAFLVLMVASVSLAMPADSPDLPENFIDRILAITKWFELRISVYRKANTLLKQLAHKVDALPPYNNGIDIYYRQFVEHQPIGFETQMKLTLVRSAAGNGTEKARVSELLQGMLKEQEVKYVLTMMPEVRNAFKEMVRQ